ncbi:universal stress protein [Subtercola frigoramans]|uniref:Nucleotide-binding universal stress UspA family protein n=1 Tax=Subtercola frigoramans TaxID=120298 RepID=A0ABS2L5P5_9MICO|nr:universal stress protein [Subtercola frigoramans]MBM7472339.1 nucleotide-binding universal stress UspA family protein [Subtercola frigoramans]
MDHSTIPLTDAGMTSSAAAVNLRDLEPVPEGTMVVGHDGSAESDAALAVALELADRLAAPVVIVRCWTIDDKLAVFRNADGTILSFTEVTGIVRARLTAELAPRVADHPGLVVQYRSALAQPGELLESVSADALMLVVGSRGRGKITGFMLGSVSSHCVHHAPCPVLVVPPRDKRHLPHHDL